MLTGFQPAGTTDTKTSGYKLARSKLFGFLAVSRVRTWNWLPVAKEEKNLNIRLDKAAV